RPTAARLAAVGAATAPTTSTTARSSPATTATTTTARAAVAPRRALAIFGEDLPQPLDRLRLEHLLTPTSREQQRAIELRQVLHPQPSQLTLAQEQSHSGALGRDAILQRRGIAHHVHTRWQRVEVGAFRGRDHRVHVEPQLGVLEVLPAGNVTQLRQQHLANRLVTRDGQ